MQSDMASLPTSLTLTYGLLALLLCLHDASAQRVPAVFMFGDSIVDPGNNNYRLTTAKGNFPPYGQDFPGHQATGRFSNGKVPGDLLAAGLGIKELLPPYLGVDLQRDDLLTGVAFASGGCGYDPLTAELSSAISTSGQLELFGEYKEKLNGLVGEEAAASIISTSIYFSVMGTNDIANNYFALPLRSSHYDLSSYVDYVVKSAVEFIEELHQMGARRIVFVGLPPIGCVPSQRTPSRECEPLRNQASVMFNSRISNEINRLHEKHSADGSKFLYLDIYYNLLELIQRPSFYGFDIGTEGCCGSRVLDAAVFIKYHSACPNVSKYIFWDSFHPSEKAYKIVVNKLLKEFRGSLL